VTDVQGRDAQAVQGQQLAAIDHGVGVGVLPDHQALQLSPFNLAVVVGVQATEGLEAVVVAAVAAEQAGTIDRTVLVGPNQQPVIGADPLGRHRESVGVEVEQRHPRLVEAGGMRQPLAVRGLQGAITIQVQDDRRDRLHVVYRVVGHVLEGLAGRVLVAVGLGDRRGVGVVVGPVVIVRVQIRIRVIIRIIVVDVDVRVLGHVALGHPGPGQRVQVTDDDGAAEILAAIRGDRGVAVVVRDPVHEVTVPTQVVGHGLDRGLRRRGCRTAQEAGVRRAAQRLHAATGIGRGRAVRHIAAGLGRPGAPTSGLAVLQARAADPGPRGVDVVFDRRG